MEEKQHAEPGRKGAISYGLRAAYMTKSFQKRVGG